MKLQEAQSCFIQWLNSARDLSSNTVRAYTSDTAVFCRHVGHEATVSDFTTDLIVSFVEAQRTAGISAASIRRRMSVLRVFSRWLVSNEHLDLDPWNQVSIEVRKPKRLPRAVPTGELDLLLSSLTGSAGVSSDREPDGHGVLERPHEVTNLVAVVLMLATGLRVGELVGLRCSDLDRIDSSIRVFGKGSRERIVFLPEHWTLRLLTAYCAMRVHLHIQHDHLLFNRRGDPMSASAMRNRLANASKVAGIQRRITPHMLRHSAATQLIESGVDIRYVQRLLGHASLSTTEIYTHVTDQSLRRVVVEAKVLERCLTRDN